MFLTRHPTYCAFLCIVAKLHFRMMKEHYHFLKRVTADGQQNTELLCKLKEEIVADQNMYFHCEKCADKKELQQPALIIFIKSSLVTSSNPVLIYTPRGKSILSSPGFNVVILLEVN